MGLTMNKKTAFFKSTKNIILFSISLITAIIFIIAATITLLGHYRASEKKIIQIQEKTALQEAIYLESEINAAANEAKTLSLIIENDNVFDDESTDLYDELIKSSLNAVPIAFGMGYWFEPYMFSEDIEYFGPYFYKDNDYNIVQTLEYSNSDYDYFSWDWYQMSFETDEFISYSKPFYDSILDTLFVTTASKIMRCGEQIGVVTIDITLREFINHLNQVDLINQTSSFLLSDDGYIISDHTKAKDALQNSIFESDDEDLKIVAELIYSDTPQKSYTSTNMVYAWAPIGTSGLSIVLSYSKNNLMMETYTRLIINIIVFLTGITILLFLTNYILNRRIDRPLKTIIHTHFSDEESIENINNLIQKEDESNLTEVLVRLMDDRQATFHKLQDSYEKLQVQNEEIQTLYDESSKMNNQLQILLNQVENGYYTTVYSLSKAIEAKDKYTNGHCENVVKYTLAIAKKLNLSESDMKIAEYSALLHDIGKIGVPSNILNKPDRLTDEEFDIIKTHSSIGYNTLKDIDFLKRVAKVVYQHHERIDGLGYPNGLKNEDIDELAKIISIADAYDAMTSSRSYRLTPMTSEKALSIIKECAGSNYDENLVMILVNLVENGEV